jgi:hypothetical protein
VNETDISPICHDLVTTKISWHGSQDQQGHLERFEFLKNHQEGKRAWKRVIPLKKKSEIALQGCI